MYLDYNKIPPIKYRGLMCNCHYVGSYTVSLMWWWIVDQRTWKHQFPTLTFKLITEIEHGYCRLTVSPILFILYLITYMYIIIIIKCKLSCRTPSTETVVFMKDTFKRDSLKKELFSIKNSRENCLNVGLPNIILYLRQIISEINDILQWYIN